MQRLIQTNINSAEEYTRIFFERQKKGINEFDLRRWKTLLEYYRGGKLIDLGCLDSLIPILAKAEHSRAEVWGIDQSEEAIEEMQNQYPKIFYHVGDLYKTKFPKSYFNYAVLGEVLEHLEEPELAIKEALRIVKRGGTLAISVPLNEAIEPGAVDGERHLYSFELEDLRRILQPYGTLNFKILRSIQGKEYKYCFPQLIIWCKKQ